MKICSVGAEFFQANGLADGQRRDEANSHFCYFANVPKKGKVFRPCHEGI
jgi:hypothetical protein